MLSKELGISRQTITAHLKTLVERGLLTRKGSTRGATYQWPDKKEKAGSPSSLVLVKQTKGLEEDRVLGEVDRKIGLKSLASENVRSIFGYAFTEMLNNAIEHSGTPRIWIAVRVSSRALEFDIRDWGVGIYCKVQRGFRLKDEFEALEHVLKGKQTTDPEHHSGEGIFFTSRAADRFAIRSHRLTATIDNTIPDTFVAEGRSFKGTSVSFSILRRSKKKLDQIFKEYSNEEFDFDKNVLRVRISSQAGALSRSQARRLLFGLDKYRRLILDFSGVKGIGQGFADEVFRVYVKSHPNTEVLFQNANPAVDFMIRRVK